MKSKGSKNQLKNVAGKERTQVKAGTSCVAKKLSPTKKTKLNGIGSSVKLDYEGSNKMQSNKCVKTVSCADSVIKNEDNVNKHHLKKRIKRLEWKQKQKDKKLKRIEKKSDVKKVIQNVTVTQRALPKTADEVSSNWKKMKEVFSKSSESDSSTQFGKGKKRKIPQDRMRNPKYRKVDKKEEKAQKDDSEPDIWFDDVDEILLERKLKKEADPVPEMPLSDESKTVPAVKNPLVKVDAFKGLTKAIGMDCEMVGVGDGTESVLARVSIVNQYGVPVYDKFVKPKEKVTDYRTFVSGVRPEDLKNAENFETVQKEVAEIMQKRILVGHSIMNDLKVLYLSHPKKKIRDTSRFKKFRQITGGRTPSLKKLSEQVLAVPIQQAEHNSIQDAQAAMRLYTMYRKEWDRELRERKFKKRIQGQVQKKES